MVPNLVRKPRPREPFKRQRLDHRWSRRSFAYDTKGGMARVLRLGSGAHEAVWSSFWCVSLPQYVGGVHFPSRCVWGFVNVNWAQKKCATKKYPAHGSLKGVSAPKDRNDLGNRFPDTQRSCKQVWHDAISAIGAILITEDKQNSNNPLIDGLRHLLAYHSSNGTKVWIIMETDRSAITIILPSEY